MMALFGWTDPRQAARYAKKANRKKIAGDAMHLMVRKGAENEPRAPAPLLDWASKSGSGA